MEGNENASLAHRVDRLERQNRRLWSAVVLVVVLAAAVGLLGAAAGKPKDLEVAKLTADVVIARDIFLTDSSGTVVRGQWAALEKETRLTMWDSRGLDGDALVTLSAQTHRGGSVFSLKGKPGKAQILMGTPGDSPPLISITGAYGEKLFYAPKTP